MFRVMIGLAVCAVAVAALLAPRGSRPVAACTGGSPSLEESARSEVIVVGDAVRVGDNTNSAPTLTPTATATATATSTPVATGTPSVSASAGAPTASPPPLPTIEPFNLTGIGATLRVVRTIAGTPAASIEVDAGARGGVEREVRRLDALEFVSSCEPDASCRTSCWGRAICYLCIAMSPDNSRRRSSTRSTATL